MANKLADLFDKQEATPTTDELVDTSTGSDEASKKATPKVYTEAQLAKMTPMQRHAHEPKVEVYLSSLMKPFMGEKFSYFYNGTLVSLEFNDTMHIFPQSVANDVQEKLKAVSILSGADTKSTQIM